MSGKLPEHCRDMSGTFPGNVRKISRKLPETSGISGNESSGNVPGYFHYISRSFPGHVREIPRKFPGNFQKSSGKFPGNFRKFSGEFSGKLPEDSWKVCGSFRGISWNSPEISTNLPRAFLDMSDTQ